MTGKRSRVISLTAAGVLSVAGAITTAVTVPSAPSAAPAGAAFANLDVATQQQSAGAVTTARPAERQIGLAAPTRYSLDTTQVAVEQAAKADATTAAARAVKKAAAKKAAAARAARAARAAAKKVASERKAASARLAQQRSAVGPSGSPEQVAQTMLGQFGWSASEFSCLAPLWGRESGWSVSASNPSSGAYGIPQALPGNRMSAAGPDWQSSAATQIKWGLQYIQSTYGSPCGAWSHEQSDGWY